MDRKKFAKQLAREFRKEGYDNPIDYKEILRELRVVMPEIKGRKKSKKLPEFLTLEEARAFIKEAYNLQNTENGFKKGLIAETFVKTGMRNFELGKLRVENIDFDTNIFKIVEGKGSKDRFGIMPSSLLRTFRLHLKGRTSGFLFLNNRGNPYSTRSIQYIIKEVKIKAGIQKEITPHSLRHTFATILKEAGVDIRDIQKLLGHENIATTTIYEHMVISDKKDEILQIMSNIN